jgi:hypothetical protein
VAVVAFEAAVNALAEGIAIHADVAARRILKSLVGMARKAIGLCREWPWNQKK